MFELEEDMTRISSKKIRDVIDAIEDDLTRRSGLRQAWDEIDTEIQEEIKEEWFNEINIILNER